MENEPRTVGIRYGIMAEPINKQLDEQNYSYDKALIKRYQKVREAINVLGWESFATDTQVSKMFQKLHNKIVKHVDAKNK